MMPVQSCQLNNRPGFQFGPTGTCYVGRGARKRAARQGRAIKASQARTDNACGCGHVHNVTTRTRSVPSNPLKADPSRTITLRRMFTVAIRKRFLRLKSLIIQLVEREDAFGLRQTRNQEQDDGDNGKRRSDRHTQPEIIKSNRKARGKRRETEKATRVDNRRFAFQSTPDQVASFEAWLRSEIDASILGGNGDRYWEAFIRRGYEKGAGRAFQDVRFSEFAAKGDDVSDFFDGTREEFLRSSFAQAESVEKIQLLVSRTFRDLKGVTEDMTAKMTRVLAEGLSQGQNPRVIARELNKQIDGLGIGSMNSVRRAEVIARTEILRAHAEGQLDSFERLGVEEVGVMAEWSTAGDDRVCPLCQPLEGVVMTIREARGSIPLHPQCVTGDSIIEADDVVALTKAKYSGEIFEILTANGRRLSVTANHILLTEFGFLPARFAYNGLNIIDTLSADSGAIETPNDNGTKTCIADIFATFTEHPLMLTSSVPTSPKNLHGDGCFCDSEIDVVLPNRELWSQWGVRSMVDLKELKFPSFQVIDTKTGLPAISPLAQLKERTARTFDSSMGRFRELQAFLLACVLHSKKHGIATPPSLETSVCQSFLDGATGNPELFSQSLNAHPILKHLDDFSVGQLQVIASGCTPEILSGLDIKPGLFESFTNTSIANLEDLGQLHGALPGVVTGDEIVGINIVHVSNLPVYDVQTKSTLYQVNGIYTSNCRCVWIPANVGEDPKKKRRVRFTDPKTGKIKTTKVGQKRTKEEIEGAIDKSLKAALPKTTKRTIAQQKAISPLGGKTIVKKRPKSVLDEPT